MISEGSCNTEDWSNDNENSKYIKKKTGHFLISIIFHSFTVFFVSFMIVCFMPKFWYLRMRLCTRIKGSDTGREAQCRATSFKFKHIVFYECTHRRLSVVTPFKILPHHRAPLTQFSIKSCKAFIHVALAIVLFFETTWDN